MAASCARAVVVLRQGLSRRLWGVQLGSSPLTFRNQLSSTSSPQPNAEQGSPGGIPPPPAANDSGQQVSNATQKAAEDALNKEKAELKKQLDDLNDKYLRAIAETQNVRMRMQRQADDAKKFGVQSMCKDLMEVADVLERAVDSGTAVPSDAAEAAKEFVRVMHEGTRMTLTQLMKVFSKHGLEKIAPAVGDKFDPNIHQALFQQPVPDAQPGSVFVVSKVGYKLHERTLRPALVGVVQASK